MIYNYKSLLSRNENLLFQIHLRYPAHWGCRQFAGARVLFKDVFQKIGIPLIHLDVDCVDERNYAPGQIMTRMEAFLEMLSNY